MVQTTTPLPIDKSLHPFQRCEQAVTHIAVLKAKPNGERLVVRLAELAGVSFGTMNQARVLMKRGTATQIDELRRGVTTIGGEHAKVREPREATMKKHKRKPKQKQKHEKLRASMMMTPATTPVVVPTGATGADLAMDKSAADRVKSMIPFIDTVADGRRWTDAEIVKLTGIPRARRFIYENGLPLIPWLKFNRTREGTNLIIDKELRAICDWHQKPEFTAPTGTENAPLPATVGLTTREFIGNMLAEITKQRKANNDDYRKVQWKSELISNRQQSSLLDWIEEQLRRIP